MANMTKSTEKRFYWLKLKEDFFTQTQIKRLFRFEKGYIYVVIFMKMQLLSLKQNGILKFDYIENDFADELAFAIDEEKENVEFLLGYLEKTGWIEKINENEYVLPTVIENTGSETKSAQRKRNQRKKAGQIPAEKGNCPTEKETDKDKSKIKDKDEQTKENPLTPYGEYKNVFLKKDEFEKLSSVCPEKYGYYIEKLSRWLEINGKQCGDCFGVINKWIMEDKLKCSPDNKITSYDLEQTEDFFENFRLFDADE